MATRSAIILKSLKIDDIRAALPQNVFPVSAQVIAERRTDYDKELDGFSGISRPFRIKMATNMPYIPRTTVIFANPVERHIRRRESGQYFEEFSKYFALAVKTMQEQDPSIGDRLYINNLVMCEIPEEYTVLDKIGRATVSPSLYEDGIEVNIATFGQVSRVNSSKVKEILSSSIPGRCIMPCELTSVLTVHCKPYLKANIVRMYYTEKEAHKWRKPKFVPFLYNKDAINRWSDERMTEIFPTLYRENLIRYVTYYGEWKDKKVFDYKDVMVRE